MPKCFFPETNSFHKQNETELYGFVWPTAVALWNLRWQVQGFVAAVPTASNDDLAARFARGSGISATQLRSACVTDTWDEQLETFARFVLVTSISSFESWLAQITSPFASPATRARQLQFPDTLAKPGGSRALRSMAANTSLAMKRNFASLLAAKRGSALSDLDAKLTAYRLFKEMRNAISHNGGIADEKCVDAYHAFLLVSAHQLGVALPTIPAITHGEELRFPLRAVVGFTGMMLRVASTIDAQLSGTREAEQVFVGWWKSRYGKLLTLPTDKVRREKRIAALCTKMGLPEPAYPPDLYTLLRSRTLVV